MKVGLTGFAGAGKTTVFTALTGLQARPAGAAAVTLGVIKVPDPRVDKLAEVYAPKKQTYAEVTFVDFPPARTTERRAVLDAPTVAQLRDADALVEVVRAFPDVTGAPATPAEDVGAFGAELVLADLAVAEKRLERLRKEKGNERERALLERLAPELEAGKALRTLPLVVDERSQLALVMITSAQQRGAGVSTGFLGRNFAGRLFSGFFGGNFFLFCGGHNSKGAPAIGRRKNGGLIKNDS